jgi:hypothetical protein
MEGMSNSPSLLSPLRGSKSKKGTSALSPYTKVLSPVPSLDGSATAPTRKKLDDGASPKKAWSTIQLPDVSAGSPSGPADGPVTPKDGGVDYETVTKERKAVEFWQQAAEKGHAESMNNLAVSYFHGRGVAKDTNKALKWWTQSADLEYTEAQHNLGVCLFNGRGVEKDHTFAAAMFARAAEKQHPDSTHMLAVCFQNGYGVPKVAPRTCCRTICVFMFLPLSSLSLSIYLSEPCLFSFSARHTLFFALLLSFLHPCRARSSRLRHSNPCPPPSNPCRTVQRLLSCTSARRTSALRRAR